MEELDGARVERVGDGVEQSGCGGVFRYCYALIGAADAQGDVGLLRVHFCELCEFFALLACGGLWNDALCVARAQHTSRGDEDGLWRTDDGLPVAHDV